VLATNPNTASQIFPLVEQSFDLVIFDEARKCPIEQARSRIYRANRLVVAGGREATPPTSFFQSGFSFGDDQPRERRTGDRRTGVKQQLNDANRMRHCSSRSARSSKPLLRQCLLNFISFRASDADFISTRVLLGRLQMPPSVHQKFPTHRCR